MRQSDPIGLAKAILWEEAKGKLRAIAAAEGAQHSSARGSDEFPHERIRRAVEEFIETFEAEGHHE